VLRYGPPEYDTPHTTDSKTKLNRDPHKALPTACVPWPFTTACFPLSEVYSHFIDLLDVQRRLNEHQHDGCAQKLTQKWRKCTQPATSIPVQNQVAVFTSVRKTSRRSLFRFTEVAEKIKSEPSLHIWEGQNHAFRRQGQLEARCRIERTKT